MDNSSSVYKNSTDQQGLSNLPEYILHRTLFASTIAIIGILGNFVCVVVLSFSARSSVNFILRAMSGLDLLRSLDRLFVLIPVFFYYFGVAEAYTHSFFPSIVPTIVLFDKLSLLICAYYLVLFSIERYLVIASPTYSREHVSWSWSRRICLCIIGAAVLIYTPLWYVGDFIPHPREAAAFKQFYKKSVLFQNPYKKMPYVYALIVALCRGFPLVAVLLFVFLIHQTIQRLREAPADLTRTQQQEIVITRILFVMVALLVLFNLANSLMDIWSSEVLRYVFIFIANLQPMSNFLIYCCLSHNFRNTIVLVFKKYCFCC